MFFHPASNGLIPLREKQPHPLPADVILMGESKVNMRYEQFEICVDIENDMVSICQDGNDGKDWVVLSINQVPAFISALNSEISQATKGD